MTLGKRPKARSVTHDGRNTRERSSSAASRMAVVEVHQTDELTRGTDHTRNHIRARHADVGDAAVPVGFGVGEGGEDDDVVF